MTNYSLPHGITRIDDPLPGLRIATSAVQGTIFFNGAHITEWIPAGHSPVLWTSHYSDWAEGSPIRGGIPVIFPWFGTGADGAHAPQHGVARISQWSLTSAHVDEDGTARIVLSLLAQGATTTPETSPLPKDWAATLRVHMGATLSVSLEITAGAQAFDYEEALHTYFAVGDITRTRITGLAGATMEDRVTGLTSTAEETIIFDREYDRIFSSTAPVIIDDEAQSRTIIVDKKESRNTVVWNPWIDKSARMADFGDTEYTTMVCVEAVNAAANAVHLNPGERHEMTQIISVDAH